MGQEIDRMRLSAEGVFRLTTLAALAASFSACDFVIEIVDTFREKPKVAAPAVPITTSAEVEEKWDSEDFDANFKELEGKWKVARYGFSRGVIAAGPEDAEPALGKILNIRPGRPIIYTHIVPGYDMEPCDLKIIRSKTVNAKNYLFPTRPEDIGVKETEIKAFETNCEGTPFVTYFKPNLQNLITSWDGAYYILERIK
ncbi:MAG: hypothetical protein HY922_09420 [Elusimicrobia bacterium]|nr:hypothetical protein [Elusimicrobiota bacterium]